MSIHERAVVHRSVDLDPSNDVGANVLIEEGVVIGKRNRIMPGAYLGPGTTIGNDNQIHLNAVLGHVPQDRSFAGEPSFLRIGDRNIIREFVTIHRGTKPGSETIVGDECFLMSGVHIAHNCRLGNQVVMVSNSAIAGYVELGDRAWISNQVGIHQFVRIGRLVMFSALSIATQDVPPFVTCGGTRRAHALGINIIGMRRAGIGPAARQAVREAYKLLYRRGLSLEAALEALRQNQTAEVQEMARFIEQSKRGIIPGPTRVRLEEESDPEEAPMELEL